VLSSLKERPSVPLIELQGADVWAIARVRPVMESVTSKLLSGNREAALAALDAYLKGDFAQYIEQAKGRLDAKEPSALMTAYTLTLTVLKLASGIMPQAAEDIYQKNLRAYEAEPSVHVVPWSEAVLVAVA
jgi:valyl-tRNA synthetase